jgi:hypothetical protein
MQHLSETVVVLCKHSARAALPALAECTAPLAPGALVNRQFQHLTASDHCMATAGTSTWREWVVRSSPSWCMVLHVSLKLEAGERVSLTRCLWRLCLFSTALSMRQLPGYFSNSGVPCTL